MPEEVIHSIKVGTGLNRSGWYLNEVPPDSQGHRLILEQDIALPGEAVLAIIDLARQFREQRDQGGRPKPLSVCTDREIAASFTPYSAVGQKNKEITLEIGSQKLEMGVATLLRRADTLNRYRETGSLREEEEL